MKLQWLVVVRLLSGAILLGELGVALGQGSPSAKADVASAPPASQQLDSQRLNDLLFQGRKLLEQGHPEEAIARYFDPVIASYEALRVGSKKRYFSARNQTESLLYLLSAAKEDTADAAVLDRNWGDAYLMKAYALVELHRISEAQTALEAAIALSPMNSQYRSELAYTYQAQKDCDRSVALYAQAASDAETASDESTKTEDVTRAWRGQGYCLVEQGKWPEAAAMYQKCLALDPKDLKAKSELQYVDQHKPN